jgi:hypothetical protein
MLKYNKKCNVMCDISCVGGGEKVVDSENLKDVITKDTVRRKLAALVSSNVQRIYSQNNSLFFESRHKFTIKDSKIFFCGPL